MRRFTELTRREQHDAFLVRIADLMRAPIDSLPAEVAEQMRLKAAQEPEITAKEFGEWFEKTFRAQLAEAASADIERAYYPDETELIVRLDRRYVDPHILQVAQNY